MIGFPSTIQAMNTSSPVLAVISSWYSVAFTWKVTVTVIGLDASPCRFSARHTNISDAYFVMLCIVSSFPVARMSAAESFLPRYLCHLISGGGVPRALHRIVIVSPSRTTRLLGEEVLSSISGFVSSCSRLLPITKLCPFMIVSQR